MNIKSYDILIKIDALKNENLNFPENCHAVELIEGMIQDAILFNLRLQSKSSQNQELVDHLERKIQLYEFIRDSLGKNNK